MVDLEVCLKSIRRCYSPYITMIWSFQGKWASDAANPGVKGQIRKRQGLNVDDLGDS